MDDEPESMAFGSSRPHGWGRAPKPWLVGVALLVAFALGLVVSGTGLVGGLPRSASGAPTLSVSIAREWTGADDGRVTFQLDVTNQGEDTVRIERVSAETSAYSVLLAAAGPRAEDGPLRMAPGEVGRVDLAVKPVCAMRKPGVTLLLTLAGEGSPRAVALAIPGSHRQLVRSKRSLCEISDRAADYPARLVGSRVPGWARGRLLVLDLRLKARGRFATGLDLEQVRQYVPGVTGHFHVTGRDPGTPLARGIRGELWLRMASCDTALGARWDRVRYPNGVGLALFVAKPGRATEVPVRRNPRLIQRVSDWVEAACSHQPA